MPLMAGAEALLAQARASFDRGELAAAEPLVRQALAVRGSSAGWNLLGVILRSTGRQAESVVAYRRGLELDAGSAPLWSNLGNALKDLKQIRSAILCHRRAVALAPQLATLHDSHAIALMHARRFADAEAAFARAVELAPRDATLRTQQALARMNMGDWRTGWQLYEARRAGWTLPEQPPGATWDGAARPDATLLVLAEQGFGDLIWSFRFLVAARQRVGRLILHTAPELVALFAAQGVADQVLPTTQKLPPADLHVFQCSLAGLLAPEPVAAAPYLRVPADRAGRFAHLRAGGAKMRIGIVWSGSPGYAANADRALPAARLLAAIALPGVALHSLQVGPLQGQLPEAAGVTDLAPLLRDFADTAAALQALDLVIMTDTAVAHLGGALGREVWVLLNHAPGWVWSCEGASAPWYRSLRLFRQRAWGDWDGVLDAVQAALLERLG